MTWTLAPDDPKRAEMQRTLARGRSRESLGNVYYPPRFRTLARPDVARHPGHAPVTVPHGPAREPGPSLSKWDDWMLRNGAWASVIIGVIGVALMGYTVARLGWAFAAWVAR